MKSRRRQWTVGKRCLLLLIVPFLCCQVSALECPADDFNSVPTSNEYDTSSYSKGALGRGLVESMRTKPESYYQSIVDNVIMTICDTDIASERCVEEGSSFAAKDWEGNCIVAADNTCPVGTCERTSNCYWNSVFEGQNRTTRFDVSAYKQASSKLIGANDSYAREMAQLGLIGCTISILLLFFWVLFFIGRYFCCCIWIPCSTVCFLCSPIPKKDGYHTFRDILIPALVYVAAVAGVVAAGSMAFVGNSDINVAISNTFLHADGLVEDLGLFLGRSKIPVINLVDIVDNAALDAKETFDGTSFVKDDALEIVDSFVGYFQLHSEGLNASNAIETFDAASSGFDEKVTPVTDTVQSMLDTMEFDLYENTDIIKGGLSSALDALDSFSDQSTEWQRVIYDYEGQELGTRDLRRAAIMAMFLVSFFFTMLGFFGILVARSRSRCLSMFSHAIKVCGFFSAWLGSLSLIIASVSLCLSFILHDACQISDIVTRDFEPLVGDKIAVGANAAFNDTNLAVAFNVSDKVDFQQKLDEGLKEIEQVNVTEKFQLVLNPLSDIQDMLGSISDSALSVFNQATSSNDPLCPFTDTYTKDNILTPWELDRDSANTPYIIRDNLGNPVTYTRTGLEDGETYLCRIYNKAGICSASTSCCIEYATPPTPCTANVYDDCDFGFNCAFPCEIIRAGILESYDVYLDLREKELAMKADLGISCPIAIDGFDDSCPTVDFRSEYSNLTLVGQVEAYKDKIIDTKDSLVNLASTSVGIAMLEVEDLLCNMNISFVEQRYDQVKYDICGTLFGGVAQINWAFWLMGISLEVIAVVSHILAIRLRGVSEKEASFTALDDWEPSNARIY